MLAQKQGKRKLYLAAETIETSTAGGGTITMLRGGRPAFVAVDELKLPIRHLSVMLACDNFLESRGMNWTPKWLKDRWSKKSV